jgi:proline iminopeptidase
MGAGSRGGWYSYDRLDNRGRPSADRVVPALQQLTVGMIFPALPGVTDCFTLLAFEPERFLILGWLSPDGRPRMTWAFVLEERATGGTRLLVRARTDSSYTFGPLPKWLSTHLGTLVHFVMQRKQLLGVFQRIVRA